MKNSKSMFIALLITVFSVAAVPAFGQFATTTSSPTNVSVDVGQTFSVDVNWSIGYNPDPTIGVEIPFHFDPSILQVVSVTGGGAPFASNELTNTFDNSTGTINYYATGSGVNSGNYTIYTIVFEAVSSGSCQLSAPNVNQYFQNYGVAGINGTNNTGTSVQVTAASNPITQLGRTPWEMHLGLATTPYTVIPITWTIPFGTPHGDPVFYQAAVIPDSNDAGWGPAPNGETIGFGSGSASVIDNAGYACMTAVDYTYFQTFVSIPSNAVVNTFTISFSGMDDGSRITMFNSDYPTGLVIPGSYVYLGATATSDLSSYVVKGEVNRVVITQVDDCPTGNNLQVAQVILNGETVSSEPNQPPVAAAGDDQSFECVIDSAAVTLDGAGSSDPDGDTLTYSWSDGSNVVSTEATFTINLGGGNYIFTLTVSDGEATASDEVAVSVALDETAPELTIPADTTVFANVAGGFSGAFGSASASDACDPTPVISHDAPTLFPLGATEVTWTATDEAGNSVSATQQVTVEPYPVLVDIKPESDRNRVNPRNHGVIPVAILTTSTFDATTVDITSVRFGPDEASPAHNSWNDDDDHGDDDDDDHGDDDDDDHGDHESEGRHNGHGGHDRHGNHGNHGGHGDHDDDDHGDHDEGEHHIEDVDEDGDLDLILHFRTQEVGVDGNTTELCLIGTASGVPIKGCDAVEIVGHGGFHKGTSDEPSGIEIPETFSLKQNYPNPFNPTTTIHYGLPEASNVNLTVYDIKGSLVAELATGYQKAGYHSVNFNASRLATGTYIYVLEVNGQRFSEKMTLMK